jgi:hypothetical protein
VDREAALKNPHRQFVIDGEAVVLGVDGAADFNALHSRKHDHEVQLYAFDIMALDGEDLRRLRHKLTLSPPAAAPIIITVFRPAAAVGPAAALWLAATKASVPARASGWQSAVPEALAWWTAGPFRQPWQ